ncbi:MAG: rRNA maturation RNase YbeY [Spongiibacteraceae bacterium]|jgi:probable rRNA maturation factor|nr:rRNA maturation RNase YbeY [Spongiibacteraceae bacterium]
MNLCLDIQAAHAAPDLPATTALETWVRAALDGHREDAELGLRIVDEPESRALNARYRGQDKPTNVLSFPADLPADLDLPLLGDLVICAPVVSREAREQHKPLAHHWAHMVVHGILHLLGYDHIDDADAEQMERLEISILRGLDIPDPYQPQDFPEESTRSHERRSI